MYNIHVVKRFRAHCGFYAIENKLLIIIIIVKWRDIIMTWVRLGDSVMLVSHCGEYMANVLTNAVRHEFVMIANDRQTCVDVRKHTRSFLWCFECYAGLTSGECMANGLTNAIRHQFAMIAK